MGPLFFAVAWHDVVTLLPRELQMNVWYLDDGHLVGSADTLANCLATIQASSSTLGVQLNLQKCRLWGPAQADLVGAQF